MTGHYQMDVRGKQRPILQASFKSFAACRNTCPLSYVDSPHSLTLVGAFTVGDVEHLPSCQTYLFRFADYPAPFHLARGFQPFLLWFIGTATSDVCMVRDPSCKFGCKSYIAEGTFDF